MRAGDSRRRSCSPTLRRVAAAALFAVPYAVLPLSPCAEMADESLPYAANAGLDMSNFLLNRNGVLPVPIFITEPAIGYGLGVALLHFSLPEGSDGSDAAALHTHSWNHDAIRYAGVVGKVSLHLDYNGSQQNAHSYLLDGIAVFQEVLFRLGATKWYVGPRYTFFDSRTRFDFGLPADQANFDTEQRVAKGGVVASYDSRDNNFYPSSGTYAQFVAEFARGGFGSSSDFEVQTIKACHWIPFARD